MMPDQRREEQVDGLRDQLLDVGARLLQDAQRLAAALVLEDLIRQRQRVADAVGIQARAQALRDDVDEVVLEILRDARHERHADGRRQQQADAAEELARCCTPDSAWRTRRSRAGRSAGRAARRSG